MATGVHLGWRTAVVAAALFMCAIPALAQAPVTLPRALPGTTIDEVRPDERRPERVSGDEVVSEEAAPPEDADAEDPANQLWFHLNGVNVTGATVYSAEDFAGIAESFVGTQVTLGGLREIGNRIERRYRDDGYVATRVIIPPQAINDGVPTLEVFEGRIIHYEINGDVGPVKKLIARYLDNLLTDEPARWEDLERYLLLSRDLPGISLTGTMRSAGDSTPGGVILVVDVARKPVDAFVNVQNRNADPTGPWTVSIGASVNSATENGERLGGVILAAVQPIEQLSEFVTYEQALGDEGLRVKFSTTQGLSEPRDVLKPLQLSTVTSLYSASLEYPAVRSRRFSLWTRGGFEYADQRTSIRGFELFDDQLRTIFAGADGVWFLPFQGVVEFDIEFRKGLSYFGGSDAVAVTQLRSRNDAQPDYTLVKGSVSHRQQMPPFFEVYLKLEGQLADKPLPTMEEIALGELTVGRGYEPGSITGDSGFGSQLELRFQPPGVDAWWLDAFQVYGFVDYGRAYDRGNPTGNPKGYEELLSAGIGTRFQVFETFHGDFYLAIPQTKALSTSRRAPNPTVNFTLTKFF